MWMSSFYSLSSLNVLQLQVKKQTHPKKNLSREPASTQTAQAESEDKVRVWASQKVSFLSVERNSIVKYFI